MARKNNAVRRNNSKGRMDRRGKGEIRLPKPKAQTWDRLEDIVIPTGKCSFQTPRRPKARFATEADARKALQHAQRNRERTGTGHVEKRFYKCPEGGCGGFHLSSREAFDDNIRKFREQQYQEQTKNARLAEIRAERQDS